MAIASTVYAASLCLVMLFSMQTVLRFDLCTEFGTVGRYLTKAMCYALSVIFLVGFIVETGRVVAAI
jgi:hypothetical protein